MGFLGQTVKNSYFYTNLVVTRTINGYGKISTGT